MVVWAWIGSVAAAQAVPVELRQTEEGWQLWRDGAPYFVKGAGGSGPLDSLAAAGANALRTWGADDLDARLDEAHRLGLTVAVGLWLGHERHGFDYHDAAQVQAQLEQARKTVLRYKDHPAVLLWGIGNEMEGYEAGDDPAIWTAVNDIAMMVKELDPAHPTMTVTADIGGARVQSVHDLCPAIDIHGINSYGGASSLPDRYPAAGGTKPYLLTEFGPPGIWEIPSNAWGAPAEPTSTQKAALYRDSYERGVASAPGLALGAFVFTWGFKMEATATWFGMFLPDGARLGAIDAMTEIWSGAPPPNRSPEVQPLALAGDPSVDPGAVLSVRSAVVDPEGGALRVHWALRREAAEFATGGDYRPMIPDLEGAVIEGSMTGARVRMPKAPGPYRLFFYAYDDAGNAATANVPLRVKGDVRMPMPVAVYEDGFEGMPWTPSGWMGQIQDIALDGAHTDNPQAGTGCIKLDYKGPGLWGGIAWQHPPDNWGDEDGGFDLTGARYLEFWARGERGGETVDAAVGLLGDDVDHPDSTIVTKKGMTLGPGWKRYRIGLRGRDLSSIKTGFVVTFAGQGRPLTIYLDSIRFRR